MSIATSNVRAHLLDETRLETAVATVLETMFFASAEDFRPGLHDCEGHHVQLRFHGAHPGAFGLVCPPKLARSLAASFHGFDDPDAASAEEAEAVLLELCNVICGNLLSQLDVGELFCLDAPRLAAPGSARRHRVSAAAGNFGALAACCEGEWLGVYLELL